MKSDHNVRVAVHTIQKFKNPTNIHYTLYIIYTILYNFPHPTPPYQLINLPHHARAEKKIPKKINPLVPQLRNSVFPCESLIISRTPVSPITLKFTFPLSDSKYCSVSPRIRYYIILQSIINH